MSNNIYTYYIYNIIYIYIYIYVYLNIYTQLYTYNPNSISLDPSVHQHTLSASCCWSERLQARCPRYHSKSCSSPLRSHQSDLWPGAWAKTGAIHPVSSTIAGKSPKCWFWWGKSIKIYMPLICRFYKCGILWNSPPSLIAEVYPTEFLWSAASDGTILAPGTPCVPTNAFHGPSPFGFIQRPKAKGATNLNTVRHGSYALRWCNHRASCWCICDSSTIPPIIIMYQTYTSTYKHEPPTYQPCVHFLNVLSVSPCLQHRSGLEWPLRVSVKGSNLGRSRDSKLSAMAMAMAFLALQTRGYWWHDSDFHKLGYDIPMIWYTCIKHYIIK